MGAGRVKTHHRKVQVYRWKNSYGSWRVYCPCCEIITQFLAWPDAYRHARWHATSRYNGRKH